MLYELISVHQDISRTYWINIITSRITCWWFCDLSWKICPFLWWSTSPKMCDETPNHSPFQTPTYGGVPRSRVRNFSDFVYPSSGWPHSSEDLSEDVDLGIERGRPWGASGYAWVFRPVGVHSIDMVESRFIWKFFRELVAYGLSFVCLRGVNLMAFTCSRPAGWRRPLPIVGLGWVPLDTSTGNMFWSSISTWILPRDCLQQARGKCILPQNKRADLTSSFKHDEFVPRGSQTD